MKTALYFTLGVALTAFTFGCTPLKPDHVDSHPNKTSTALDQKIQAVKDQFAPDRHLALFTVEATMKGNAITLEGEVDNAEAKAALIKSVSEISPNVTDEITVLPSKNLNDKTYGISVVSAATVREDPAPGAELGTQVLLGHSFKLLKSQGAWFYVQSKDGYLGWMERDQFIPCTIETVTAWSNAPQVIVTAYADHVWQDTGKGLPVCDVVPGCLLKKIAPQGEFLQVALADGRSGYILNSSVSDFDAWKKSRTPTPEAIEKTAKSLLGTPYLWGGTSTKMLDCSGFTKTVYFLNGIDLLRNASHQYRQGTPIEPGKHLENLHKGDLLFFGHHRDGKTKVTHVGIYLEKGLFIHSSGLVHIGSLDPDSELRDEARIKALLGARRILPE
jgi:cell wall-associated NlpC family hydrolase